MPEAATDRFELLEPLGRGAFGEVHRAQDRELGREVALKRLTAAALAGPEVARRFQREALLMARVHHPNVVRVFDCDLGGEDPWIAMELLRGRDLEAVLREDGPLDGAAAARLLRELAAGVKALNDAGVLHRDLKPANVMLREDGSSVVMDMGLAAAQDVTVLTRTGQVVGSPAYLPPEVVLGEEWTTAGDAYQVGAIVHEAWTGTRLVPGESMESVISNAAGGVHTPIPPGRGPEPIRRAVTGLCAADPGQRLALASVEEILGGASLPVTGPEGTGRGRPPRLAIAAAFLGLVVVGATVDLPGTDAPPPAASVPAPREEPPGPARPGLPADIAARLARDRTRVEGRGVAGLDPDPVEYRSQLLGLPTAYRVLEYVGRTGDLDALREPAVAAELEGIDAVFDAAGLPPPFAPYLETRAATQPLEIPRGEITDREHEKEVLHLTGWAATAARHLVAAARFRRARAGDHREGRTPFDGKRRSLQIGSWVGFKSFANYLHEITGTREMRLEVARWLAPGMEELRRGLVAARRALARGTEEGLPDSWILGAALREAEALYRSGAFTLPIEVTMGGPHETELQAWIAGMTAHRVAITMSHMGFDPESHELAAEAALARALEGLREEEILDHHRQAANWLILTVHRPGRLDELPRALEVVEPVLRKDPGWIWSNEWRAILDTHVRKGWVPGLSPARYAFLRDGARAKVAGYAGRTDDESISTARELSEYLARFEAAREGR